MATIQRTASVDSFIEKLNTEVGGEEFVAWAQTLKMDNGKSLFDVRKQLSHDNKKRPEGDGSHLAWTPEAGKDYDSYKAQSKRTATTKRDYEIAAKDFKDYRKDGGRDPQMLRSLLDKTLKKAEEWSDASVQDATERLNFMVKYEKIFDKDSTKNHIKQAQDNLRGAKTARIKARHFQTQLDQLVARLLAEGNPVTP
ncbi:hypothetical protein F4680DRAFT_448729 [Xylaria scruposa]|nr:hypothetical protein F4680DRAFT_448729 [Xylaria scruposa]